MQTDQQQPFEQWAVVELFGHQRIAGKVTEQTIGGCSFVRVDVPALDTSTVTRYGRVETIPAAPGFTKLYGNGAIYGMTFVTEDTAKAAAANMRVQPIDAYGIEEMLRASGKLPALPERATSGDPFDEEQERDDEFPT